MGKEFKSFFKIVGGNEGNKCNYPTRLDTYGCGCSHDCKYCLGGDTNILMYDGSLKKLKELNTGDEVYGVSFDGKYYRYTKSIIENKWAVNKKAFKITLANGVELICSGDHQWLTNRGWKYTTGTMTGESHRACITDKNFLKGLSTLTFDTYTETEDYIKGYLCGIIKGDGNLREYHYGSRDYRNSDDQYYFRVALKESKVVERTKQYLEHFGIDTQWFDFPMIDRTTKEEYITKAIRTHKKENYDYINQLIQPIESTEFLRGFLAGIYDTEGSSSPTIKRIYNSDAEIISLIQKGFDEFGFKYIFDKEKKSGNTTIKPIRLLGGMSEFVRFFIVTNPSIKRYACLENVALKNSNYKDLKVVSIEPYSDNMELYDITTSTRNFIANGVVSHNCYAKSLLDFRDLWNPLDPSIADINKIRRTIENKLHPGDVVRLGGMTDCFQPIEAIHHITYETIKCLNEHNIGYLIVTKSNLVASDEYINIMNKDLAHIQITVTTTDDELSKTYEKATVPSERIKAIEKLQANGFDVQLRLSPFIPEYVDLNIINNVKCDKILVEFLRVNTWIERWFNLDYSNYTVKQSGYKHLPLEMKKELISKITGFKEISVCEDESNAYEYWQNNFNHNPNDCCNLRK